MEAHVKCLVACCPISSSLPSWASFRSPAINYADSQSSNMFNLIKALGGKREKAGGPESKQPILPQWNVRNSFFLTEPSPPSDLTSVEQLLPEEIELYKISEAGVLGPVAKIRPPNCLHTTTQHAHPNISRALGSQPIPRLEQHTNPEDLCWTLVPNVYQLIAVPNMWSEDDSTKPNSYWYSPVVSTNHYNCRAMNLSLT